jgi:hypothetical protein
VYLLVFLRESLTFFLSFTPLRKRKEKQTHLLGCDAFRAENAREEHARAHIYTRARIFRRVSIETRKMCARECSQNSLVFLVFLVYFLKGDKCSLQKSADARIR